MILEATAKCLANSNVSYNNLFELIDRCLLIMVLVLGGFVIHYTFCTDKSLF